MLEVFQHKASEVEEVANSLYVDIRLGTSVVYLSLHGLPHRPPHHHRLMVG